MVLTRVCRRTVRDTLFQGLLLLALAAGCAAQVHAAQARLAARGNPGMPSHPAALMESRPVWTELNPAQQQALAPLAPHWSGLTESHKRKWLALSRNFDHLSATEQSKLQDRMLEWSKLSAEERIQARLNYAETRKLTPDEKKSRWEAYKALTDEQRSKLAAAAPKRPPGAAAAVKPTPVRLARLPVQGAGHADSRIGVSATEVDHNTLLPQHPSESLDVASPAEYR